MSPYQCGLPLQPYLKLQPILTQGTPYSSIHQHVFIFTDKFIYTHIQKERDFCLFVLFTTMFPQK